MDIPWKEVVHGLNFHVTCTCMQYASCQISGTGNQIFTEFALRANEKRTNGIRELIWQLGHVGKRADVFAFMCFRCSFLLLCSEWQYFRVLHVFL